MQKIAIIGAGLTGITLALELRALAKVTLFEKARGVGGRLATRYKDPFQFDHGAQYFTVKSQQFHDFIQPLLKAGVIARWDANFVELNANRVISSRKWGEHFPHYVGQPGMDSLCQYLARDLDVRLSTRVTRIQCEKGWQLFDEQQQDLGYYDWVIITAPAPQAAQLMPASFQYLQQLNTIQMLGCYSLMLGFDKLPALNFDAASVQNETISWISVNSSKPRRPICRSLLINSTNQWAEENMHAADDWVIEQMSEALQRVTGLHNLNPECYMLMRWRYANIGPQENQQGFIDMNQQLVACGDWCLRGRVESAYLVGYNVAQQLRAVM